MVSKTELVEKIAENTGVAKSTVKTVLTGFWEAVTTEVEKGEEVRLIGTGKFYKKHSNARIGHNPSTGEAIEIAASDRLAFKSSIKF